MCVFILKWKHLGAHNVMAEVFLQELGHHGESEVSFCCVTNASSTSFVASFRHLPKPSL